MTDYRTKEYSTNDLLNEIYDDTIKEAIRFFSQVRFNKSQDDERFFYKKEVVETIKEALPKDAIEVSTVLGDDGSIFCYRIIPIYNKKTRNYHDYV